MRDKINIYLTADNIISSLGFTTKENLCAIEQYRSGITLHSDGKISDMPIMAACINNLRLEEQIVNLKLQSYTRLEQICILSITNTIEQSGISPGDPGCGIIFASTKGNIDDLSGNINITPDDITLWNTAKKVSSYFQAGDNFWIISNACISGVSAMIVAKRLIEQGFYNNVIVTGADVLSHFITSGFLSFKSISPEICRPFDVNRDGLSLGEGCGTILLSTNGAPGDILLSGGSITNDANHISGPSRTGDGLCYAISQAMREANVSISDIDFINTHGTATVYNDEMESKAIHLAGLQDSSVNSLKSYFGHTLGAAGIIETILCAYQLKNDIIYGTHGFNELGVSKPIRVNAEHHKQSITTCVKTASGFGGCNAAIILAKQSKKRIALTENPVKTKDARTITIHNGIIEMDGSNLLDTPSDNFHTFIRKAYKDLGEANMKFYKMDDLGKLGYIASCHLLKNKTFDPLEIGIILSNANSSLDTDIKHQEIIDKDGDAAASPAIFVYTLPNVLSGEICIRHKIQGENTFFISKEYNPEELENYAKIVMAKTNLKYCIVGWCEFLKDKYSAHFKLLEN